MNTINEILSLPNQVRKDNEYCYLEYRNGEIVLGSMGREEVSGNADLFYRLSLVNDNNSLLSDYVINEQVQEFIDMCADNGLTVKAS